MFSIESFPAQNDGDRFSHTLFRSPGDSLHAKHVGSKGHKVDHKGPHGDHLVDYERPHGDVHYDTKYKTDDNINFPAQLKHLSGNYPREGYFDFNNHYSGLAGNVNSSLALFFTPFDLTLFLSGAWEKISLHSIGRASKELDFLG